MNGVPAEVTQKICMFLQHDYLNPRASKQKSQHHAGGTAAYDTAGNVHLRHKQSSLLKNTSTVHLPIATTMAPLSQCRECN